MKKTAAAPITRSTAKDDRTKQHQLRIKESFRARISAYQAKLSQTMGVSVTFSDALRSLIERGLQSVERGAR